MRKEIKNIIEYFSKRKEVAALYIFGTFDTPKERSDSDIDLAVLLDTGELHEQNHEVYKAEYYNTSPEFSSRCVDIVILNNASPALKYVILKTGTILMDKNPELRRYFTAVTLNGYFEYTFIEEIYFAALKKRLREAHG